MKMQVTIITILLVLVVCVEAALEDTAPDTDEAEASPPLIVFSEVVSLNSDLTHEAADTAEAAHWPTLHPDTGSSRSWREYRGQDAFWSYVPPQFPMI